MQAGPAPCFWAERLLHQAWMPGPEGFLGIHKSGLISFPLLPLLLFVKIVYLKNYKIHVI